MVATIVKSTAAHVQSLSHWFRLLTRWRKEAVILLTKSRSSKARHPNQKSSRACCSATSKELTVDPSSRKDSIQCQRPGKTQASGRSIAVPWCPGTRDPSRVVPQSDVRSQENTGQASGDRFVCPKFNQESRCHRKRSVRLERLPLDAKKRTTECIVVIRTQRVPKSR